MIKKFWKEIVLTAAIFCLLFSTNSFYLNFLTREEPLWRYIIFVEVVLIVGILLGYLIFKKTPQIKEAIGPLFLSYILSAIFFVLNFLLDSFSNYEGLKSQILSQPIPASMTKTGIIDQLNQQLFSESILIFSDALISIISWFLIGLAGLFIGHKIATLNPKSQKTAIFALIIVLILIFFGSMRLL